MDCDISLIVQKYGHYLEMAFRAVNTKDSELTWVVDQQESCTEFGYCVDHGIAFMTFQGATTIKDFVQAFSQKTTKFCGQLAQKSTVEKFKTKIPTIRDVVTENTPEKFILIGFSQGGMLVRLLHLFLTTSLRIRSDAITCIIIGAPKSIYHKKRPNSWMSVCPIIHIINTKDFAPMWPFWWTRNQEHRLTFKSDLPIWKIKANHMIYSQYFRRFYEGPKMEN